MKRVLQYIRPHRFQFGLAIMLMLWFCSAAAYASNLGNSNSNLAAYGQLLIDDSDVYLGFTAEELSTVRISLETGETTRLLHYQTNNLNLMDGWMYVNFYRYPNLPDPPSGVYKCRTDGSDLTRLVDRPLRDLHVYQDTIYGILPEGQEGRICAIRTDGTDFRILSDTCFRNLSVDEDGMLYALQQDRLHRINPANGSASLLLDYAFTVVPSGYLLDGDTILYYDQSHIFAMPKDGSALPTEVVAADAAITNQILNFSDQRVLYRKYNNETGTCPLLLLDLNTGAVTELPHTAASFGFCVSGNLIVSCLVTDPSGQPMDMLLETYTIGTGAYRTYDTIIDETPMADFSGLGDGFRVHEIQTDADMANISSINEDGILSVCPDGSYQLTGVDGEVKFRRDNIYVRAFSEGMAVARYKKDGALSGYIDISGNFILPPQYKEAGDFSSGLALVRLADGRQAFIRKDGSYAYIAEDGEILESFQDGFCIAYFPDCTRIFNTSFQAVGIQYGGVLRIFGATKNAVVLISTLDTGGAAAEKNMVVSRDGRVLFETPYQKVPNGMGIGRMIYPADTQEDLFYTAEGAYDENSVFIPSLTLTKADGTAVCDLSERLHMITRKSALINYRLVPNGTAFERYERAETVADFYDARLEPLGSLRYRSYVLRPAYPAWSNGVVSAYWALTLPEEYYQDGQTWPVYVIEAVQH